MPTSAPVPEPTQPGEYVFKYFPKPQGQELHKWIKEQPDRRLGQFFHMVHYAAKDALDKKPVSYMRMLDIAYGSGMAGRNPDNDDINLISPAVASILNKDPYFIPKEIGEIYPKGQKIPQPDFDTLVLAFLSQNHPELALQMITSADDWLGASPEGKNVENAMARLFSLESDQVDKSPFMIAVEVLSGGEPNKKKDFFYKIKDSLKGITDLKIMKAVKSQLKYVYEAPTSLNMGEDSFAKNFPEWQNL